ncbi:MAG: aminoacyl-tRNA hydrolase [Clostridiaceae bacterium]|jgi:PTH1 family peptidyl-tRNA hydrolase|nr:aminoacyl-tRNA hydrolase [Clostridiaceae bacterium]
MFVFVGLGNPGRQYAKTRHNIGFECIDYISYMYKIPIMKTKFKAHLGEGFIQGEKVLLVKPQTYMNNSGESLREIVEYYKLDVDKLVVIYDDVDLDLGIIRIRPHGSSGTHNGMRSIIYQLRSDEFPRIRIGIGRPEHPQDLVSFVLGKLTTDEQQIMAKAIEKVGQSVAEIVASGIDMAMSKYNGKASDSI